ncbi:hypothetical protein Efla_000246 [Eimeria flavescens]
MQGAGYDVDGDRDVGSRHRQQRSRGIETEQEGSGQPACAPTVTPEAIISAWVGDLLASQLAEPDDSVAPPDVVLRASFEEPSELSEENRHRVLGTFRYTPPRTRRTRSRNDQGCVAE